MARKDRPVKSEHQFRQRLDSDMIKVLARRLAELIAGKTDVDIDRVQAAFRKVEPGEIRMCWGRLAHEGVLVAVGVSDNLLMFLKEGEDEAISMRLARLVRFDRSEQIAYEGSGRNQVIAAAITFWGICAYTGPEELDTVLESGRQLRNDELTFLILVLPLNGFTVDLGKRMETALATVGIPSYLHRVKPFLG